MLLPQSCYPSFGINERVLNEGYVELKESLYETNYAVLEACNNAMIMESYGADYEVVTEGIGDIFKAIIDAIVNFFKKIFEWLGNLFGGGSSSGGSSSGGSSSGSSGNSNGNSSSGNGNSNNSGSKKPGDGKDKKKIDEEKRKNEEKQKKLEEERIATARKAEEAQREKEKAQKEHNNAAARAAEKKRQEALEQQKKIAEEKKKAEEEAKRLEAEKRKKPKAYSIKDMEYERALDPSLRDKIASELDEYAERVITYPAGDLLDLLREFKPGTWYVENRNSDKYDASWRKSRDSDGKSIPMPASQFADHIMGKLPINAFGNFDDTEHLSRIAKKITPAMAKEIKLNDVIDDNSDGVQYSKEKVHDAVVKCFDVGLKTIKFNGSIGPSFFNDAEYMKMKINSTLEFMNKNLIKELKQCKETLTTAVKECEKEYSNDKDQSWLFISKVSYNVATTLINIIISTHRDILKYSTEYINSDVSMKNELSHGAYEHMKKYPDRPLYNDYMKNSVSGKTMILTVNYNMK